jgi:hypothetical protein
MSYYAKVRNGSVQLFNQDSGIPIQTFGYGSDIVSALVSGDSIFCESRTGTTFVYDIVNGSANLTRTFR